MTATASPLDAVMPAVSRALANGNPWEAYGWLRRLLPIGTAGPALLQLTRTEPGWVERVRESYHPERAEVGLDAELLAERMGSVEPAHGLTDREVRMLVCSAEGLTNAETGELLCVSVHTINGNVRKLLPKLGAKNMAEAVAVAFRRGIIE